MTTWYILTLGEDRYVVVVGAGYQVNHLGTVSDTVRDLQLISTQTFAIIIANQILVGGKFSGGYSRSARQHFDDVRILWKGNLYGRAILIRHVT